MFTYISLRSDNYFKKIYKESIEWTINSKYSTNMTKTESTIILNTVQLFPKLGRRKDKGPVIVPTRVLQAISPPKSLRIIQNILCRNVPIAEQIEYKATPLSEYMVRMQIRSCNL